MTYFTNSLSKVCMDHIHHDNSTQYLTPLLMHTMRAMCAHCKLIDSTSSWMRFYRQLETKQSSTKRPVSLLRHDAVARLLASGSTAFSESCVAIGWKSRQRQIAVVIQVPGQFHAFDYMPWVAGRNSTPYPIWTNVDKSLVRLCDIHPRWISQPKCQVIKSNQ